MSKKETFRILALVPKLTKRKEFKKNGRFAGLWLPWECRFRLYSVPDAGLPSSLGLSVAL